MMQKLKQQTLISTSLYGESYSYHIDQEMEKDKIDKFAIGRKTVVVQGLGFVGSAMVAALSNAKDEEGNLIYNVIGVDLPCEGNYWKIARTNDGKSPVLSSDESMNEAFKEACDNKNLLGTYSDYAYAKADIVVVDIQLDVQKKSLGNSYDYMFSYEGFKGAMETIANNISEDTLVIIETTVPPGTTQEVVYPIFKEMFQKRGLDINKFYLAHSYERVMPGIDYLNSIINFYRVYSGINNDSRLKAKDFFESFINTKDYPLSEMHSPTASEMAKVLENSFRTVNIAFIQEWTEYAQKAGVDLFEVIHAIKMRPTHKNIMMPGFGVGGYCLPKDSLLGDWSHSHLFEGEGRLKMTLDAVAINDVMPEYTFRLLKEKVGDLNGKKITILGISYLNDIADTRHSPTELFYENCNKGGASIRLHDPLIAFWSEKELPVNTDMASLKNEDHEIAVFTVRHKEYLNLTDEDIVSLLPGVKLVIDANNVINDDVAKKLSQRGVATIGIGKGHWEGF